MSKTEICRNWENGYCQYGSKCTFAHGRHELQERLDIPQNYKTKLCEKFHGPQHHCSYGQRCTFVHSRPPPASQSSQSMNNGRGSGSRSGAGGGAGKRQPSHSDNLNLIIGQICARSETHSEFNLRPISNKPLKAVKASGNATAAPAP